MGFQFQFQFQFQSAAQINSPRRAYLFTNGRTGRDIHLRPNTAPPIEAAAGRLKGLRLSTSSLRGLGTTNSSILLTNTTENADKGGGGGVKGQKICRRILWNPANLCRTRLCDDDDGEMRSRSQSRAERDREGERDGQFFCGSSPTNSHVAHSSLAFALLCNQRKGGREREARLVGALI